MNGGEGPYQLCRMGSNSGCCHRGGSGLLVHRLGYASASGGRSSVPYSTAGWKDWLLRSGAWGADGILWFWDHLSTCQGLGPRERRPSQAFPEVHFLHAAQEVVSEWD